MENLEKTPERIKREETPEKKITLEVLEDYIKERKELSKDDLSILAKEFGIPIEDLIRVSENIKKELYGDSKETEILTLTTTYHLNPWEIFQYLLAKERITLVCKRLGKWKNFDLPVTWTQEKNEKFSEMFRGLLNLPIQRIFGIQITNKTTALDFYNKLKEEVFEKFDDKNLEENYKRNIKRYLSDSGLLGNYTEKEKNKIVDELYSSIKDVITDFFDFYEKEVKVSENERKFENAIQKIFEEEKLRPILERLELNKENYKSNLAKIVFLICILSGAVHVGAEWPKEDEPGKYNIVRQALGLPLLPEFAPNVFFERYSFISEGIPDSFTLRLILGEYTKNIINVAAIEERESGPFSPFKILKETHLVVVEDFTRRIRIFDFIHKYSKDEIFEKMITRQELERLIEKLPQQDKERLEEALKDVKADEKISINQVLEKITKGNKFILERGIFKTLVNLYIENPKTIEEIFGVKEDILEKTFRGWEGELKGLEKISLKMLKKINFDTSQASTFLPLKTKTDRDKILQFSLHV